MTGTKDLSAKFLGCMVGSALGDATGEMAFRMPEEAALRAWIPQAGELVYTDDTAMAIGLAQNLVDLKKRDGEERKHHELRL